MSDTKPLSADMSEGLFVPEAARRKKAEDEDLEAFLKSVGATMEAKGLLVDEDAWKRDQERIRFEEVRDELEATIPGSLRWARFASNEWGFPLAPPTPKYPTGRLVVTSHEVQQSRDAVISRYPHVIWIGKAGAGKSSLAAAALREWTRGSMRSSMFAPVRRLASARSQHKLGAGEAPYIARAMSVSMLLIDDLGGEVDGDVKSSAISDIIRERVEAGKALWITTGLGRNELEKCYDGGAIRRLFEHSFAIHLKRDELRA